VVLLFVASCLSPVASNTQKLATGDWFSGDWRLKTGDGFYASQMNLFLLCDHLRQKIENGSMKHEA